MSRAEVRRRRPLLVVAPAALGIAFFGIPLLALLVRVPWTRLAELLTGDLALPAIRLSLVSSLLATAVAALVGVPLGWLLARGELRFEALVRGLVLLPLVLPPVVGGTLLLFALGRTGLLGAPLEAVTGLVLPFSTTGVVLAAAFVALPFMVISVEGALRSLDPGYEAAAHTLGAASWMVLTRISLPLIWPALAAGLALTWARAFGEFGATLAFAGNLPGRTQTLPLAVLVALGSDRDAALALSLLMVGVSMAILLALRNRWWRAL